jgi:cytochrome P450
LYDLIAYPEYVEPLREEIKAHLFNEEGTITKASMYNCKLLDSFLKESVRMNPAVLVNGKRVIRKTITLSDGTHLPAGTWVGVPVDAISHDPRIFPNPKEFDGFRFSKLREVSDGNRTSGGYHQLVTSNKTNLAFGFGRHSCPGRFFAAAEIKMILAFIILNYDIKFKDPKIGRPKNLVVSDFVSSSQALIAQLTANAKHPTVYAK